jgi:hypothetical protein
MAMSYCRLTKLPNHLDLALTYIAKAIELKPNDADLYVN